MPSMTNLKLRAPPVQELPQARLEARRELMQPRFACLADALTTVMPRRARAMLRQFIAPSRLAATIAPLEAVGNLAVRRTVK